MSNPQKTTPSTGTKPDYVAHLEAAYGAPSQNAFGSAVFFETLQPGDYRSQRLRENHYHRRANIVPRPGIQASGGITA